MKQTYVVPCLFGLEGIVADELKFMDCENVITVDGRVSFDGDYEMLARVLVNLRCGERVMIKLGEFHAYSFEDLFQGVKKIQWEDFIGKEDAFPVKGHAIKSKLYSVPDCQSIVKKAVVDRLTSKYGISWFNETGVLYQISFAIMNDVVTVMLDATGVALHKRGYRPQGNDAPIRETLAAAMVKLSRFRAYEEFCDPLCGSGTIAIEAAMQGANMAPGLKRRFSGEEYGFIDKKVWTHAREEAVSKIRTTTNTFTASDIDAHSIALAKLNAKRAGVDHLIKFEVKDVFEFKPYGEKGVIICNPPYGERMLDIKTAESLYKTMGQVFSRCENYRKYIITSHEGFEWFYGTKATRKRKLYNGMIKCDLYQYLK